LSRLFACSGEPATTRARTTTPNDTHLKLVLFIAITPFPCSCARGVTQEWRRESHPKPIVVIWMTPRVADSREMSSGSWRCSAQLAEHLLHPLASPLEIGPRDDQRWREADGGGVRLFAEQALLH